MSPSATTATADRSNHQFNNNEDDTSNLKNDESTMSKKSTDTNNSSANGTSAAASFKLMLLVLMVLQNSSTVLVGRHTRTAVADKKDLYVVNHLILVTEVGKLLLSCVLEYHATNGQLAQSFYEHIWSDPYDALKISVPALLYLVQNSLLYIALSNLTAPIFQVTYQGKLVTTALVSVVMLQRSYNLKQWICLVALSLGVAIVVLGEQQGKKSTDDNKPAQSLAVGLVAVTIACMSSALAGVYFEKVVKTASSPAKRGSDSEDGNGASAEPKPPVSLWMRNIQLAFFSIVVAMGQSMYDERIKSSSVSSSEQPKLPYLHGFTMWVWILVALQAGGGLLVAAVIKYADNVLKGLATGVSVVVATVCSMILFGTPLSGQFTLGAIMILISVYLFSNDVPNYVLSSMPWIRSGGKVKNTEMNPILPK